MEGNALRGVVLVTMVVIVILSSSVMAGYSACIGRCLPICQNQGCSRYNCEGECLNNCLPFGPGSQCGCHCKASLSSSQISTCTAQCFKSKCNLLNDEAGVESCIKFCSNECE